MPCKKRKGSALPGSSNSPVNGKLYTTSDHNRTTMVTDCQDFSEVAELAKKWKPKRSRSELLSGSYTRLGLKSKSNRVAQCGTFLSFAHEVDNAGIVSPAGKLHQANFCRDRLCPMCTWRKSLKLFGQCSQIMELIGNDYCFVFVTLTVPSVSGDMLPDTVSRLFRAWNLFSNYKAVKSATVGYFRALEVTRNNRPYSKSFGLYHPHFHVVFAVRPSYFKKSAYLHRDEWLALWQRAYGDDTITQVDVRRASDPVSDTAHKAVAEIAKYAVKDTDYIRNSEDETDLVVNDLSRSLRGRRLVSYGGVFRTAFDKLGLQDIETADLVHVSDDDINDDLKLLIVRYGWKAGAYVFESQFMTEKEKK